MVCTLPVGGVVVSVDGLLDAHEVVARSRVEALRAQAEQVAAQLAEAELAVEHVAITRATLALAIAGRGGASGPGRGQGAREYVVVPVWRAGLTGQELPGEYRRVWQVVAGASGPVRAKEVAGLLGWEASAARIESMRSRLKRLVERGWLTQSAPGMFTPARPLAPTAPSPGGGS